MFRSQLLLLLTISSIAYGLFGTMKNVTVTVGSDDKLNMTYTNDKGQFKIYGEAREIRNIEPYLKVHHFCKNGVHDVKCEMIDRFDVPKQYQGKVYSLGLIDLAVATEKRKEKCHK
uniref:Transthyretin-like family protein n=1 Tax=Wuchereria bancrofti TaxID=6293 RepID=A0A1I8EW24_WUCBA